MTQALFILAAFIVFAGLFASLRMGTVVGLLIAGVAIGPSGAGIVDDVTARLLALEGIEAGFYDVTHKPPGTVEWE